MSKNITYVLLLLLVSSCQKTNDYYSDIDDSSIENVKINNLKGLDLSFSAIKINDKLVIISYVRLLDTTIILEDINLRVNGLQVPVLQEKEFFKESGERLSFDKFKEIKDYINNDSQFQKYTPLYYKFEDPRVLIMDDLNFRVSIKSNLDTISKQIIMKRHSRYRSFLEGG